MADYRRCAHVLLRLEAQIFSAKSEWLAISMLNNAAPPLGERTYLAFSALSREVLNAL